MSFIRNAWYVGMWAEGLVPNEPRERTIIGESIVFFRGTEGQPVALENRCPHRAAPLHAGRVCPDGSIECAYHGLRFDATGACVKNPHGKGAIPAAAHARSYPAMEKHSLIWVWLGEAAADPERIPDLSVIDHAAPEDVTYRDVLEMDSHYELVVDNLLDLSHTAFLHRGVLGNDDTVSAEIRVASTSDSVTASRWMPGVAAPGLFDMMFRRDGGLVDHWAEITWLAPSCLINDSGVSALGAPRAEGTGIWGLHLLTPIHERKTRYHFAAVRQNPLPFAEPIRQDIMLKLKDLRRKAFTMEDEPMIVAQQRMLDAAGPDFRPVFLEVDGAAVRYRRVLDRLREADLNPSSVPA
ncbi:MAG: Rieske 2Fe-2S domain-containing protein [Pigmentiphaga sp.]